LTKCGLSLCFGFLRVFACGQVGALAVRSQRSTLGLTLFFVGGFKGRCQDLWLTKPNPAYAPNESDDLLIQCHFKSHASNVVWRKNNAILAVNRIVSDLNKNYKIVGDGQSSSSLLITNITSADSAVYTCSLTNDYGLAFLSANTTVNVTGTSRLFVVSSGDLL
jgi:hypothetical protein